MKKSLLIFLPLTALFFFTNCAHKVTRIDPSEQIDLSGRWNNTDSRLTAEEMTKTILAERWLTDYMGTKNGQRPTVIVGMVNNKSHEHIEAETFIKDIENAFVSTGRVRLVQGGKKREELRAEKADQQTNASSSTMKKFGLEQGADFILQGSINSIVDSQKRKKVVYYQINLELTNIETNEVVYVGEKKIAKYVKN
ncbi:penicillin-binding protein activator LpoB [Terrimonas sp. NA20]|uniref:Penicillin-binding protein activator LpoB n=1 Tax=Terrimonas ginsenosidimutans TaxID=2908004 RepID=A0ABS9KZ27_9BACT|nr:penicillin-binding protein activator LpoB [Terrimonas ginsenosidimutans]MCG2617469.1 penicillin-binding protein activator LpoB [Terrimonas ginsenosidimutans]